MGNATAGYIAQNAHGEWRQCIGYHPYPLVESPTRRYKTITHTRLRDVAPQENDRAIRVSAYLEQHNVIGTLPPELMFKANPQSQIKPQEPLTRDREGASSRSPCVFATTNKPNPVTPRIGCTVYRDHMRVPI